MVKMPAFVVGIVSGVCRYMYDHLSVQWDKGGPDIYQPGHCSARRRYRIRVEAARLAILTSYSYIKQKLLCTNYEKMGNFEFQFR